MNYALSFIGGVVGGLSLSFAASLFTGRLCGFSSTEAEPISHSDTCKGQKWETIYQVSRRGHVVKCKCGAVTL